MKEINLTPYEEKDILQVLDFAQQIYEQRSLNEKDGVSRYWVRRIKQLKKTVKGQTLSKLGSIESTIRTFEEW